MRRTVTTVLFLGLATVAATHASPLPVTAKTVVFSEPGFPTLESEALSREMLTEAFAGQATVFAGIDELSRPETLRDANLLVLPYGSAFPADAWPAIRTHLESGGNLLTLGGRALWVPVWREDGRFRADRPQNTYWRLLSFVNTTEVPVKTFDRFAWHESFDFLPAADVRARRVFTFNSQHVTNYSAADCNYRGMGFFLDKAGHRSASPVTRLDFTLTPRDAKSPRRGRLVMLNFEPQPGYWSSPAGCALLGEMARYAALVPVSIWVELPMASLLPEETAEVIVRTRDLRFAPGTHYEIRVELRRDGRVLDTQTLPATGAILSEHLFFPGATTPGLYEVRATYESAGRPIEVYETGFWRRDAKLLTQGPRLTAGRTYLHKDGAPFLPVGVNHYSNDPVWGDFPRTSNGLVWDRDFAAMQARHITFIRTGIWDNRLYYTDVVSGGATESVLRNIESFLLAAARHDLHVQFTFYAFDPQTALRWGGEAPIMDAGRNPYTDPIAIDAQKRFVHSIVERFKDVPFLSWDLINEPSFSSARALFRGNVPNADATEVAAWNGWLQKRYGSTRALAAAWNVAPADLADFGAIRLPPADELRFARQVVGQQVRAFDYNLFAQDMFRTWLSELVGAIRATGSQQLITVGHDEGGITDRVLNQFYGDAGLGFTAVHTWWYDDALLWSVLAPKVPGLPNFVGETGPQPVYTLDGRSRWDETQGLGLTERKLALGLGAGSAGAAYWIWSNADTFRLGRQDGSDSLWTDMLERFGAFADRAAPFLSDARPSDVAMVVPQSLQLSALSNYAIEAQQKCIRALSYHARAVAEVVGEYQLERLGSPKLILLPSPWTLSQPAWERLIENVRGGATLLVTGRFDADEHFHATDRHRAVGLAYEPAILTTRENAVAWPGGHGRAVFGGDKCTYIEQAVLPGGQTFARRPLGKGQILFFSLPLELNDDLALLGAVYRFALAETHVAPLFRTSLDDTGVLICPTPLERATLYVLMSESSSRHEVEFTDVASGKQLSVNLPPGRAALLLVTHQGEIVARYDPTATTDE
jgi:hypothetical protein